jgi:ribonuclease P protein component
LIWSIRDRTTFVRLRTEGIRVRQGPLGISYLPPATAIDVQSPPRVAFAIGRKVGHAVERNRLRRRLRAVLAAIEADALPAGAYLFTAQADAAALSHQELREHVERALTRIAQRTAADPGRQAAR